MAGSGGIGFNNRVIASRPPAEAPTPTTGNPPVASFATFEAVSGSVASEFDIINVLVNSSTLEARRGSLRIDRASRYWNCDPRARCPNGRDDREDFIFW